MREEPNPGKLLSWLPLAALAPLLAFVLISFLKHGVWPAYGQPDPSQLQLPLLHGASFFSFVTAPIAALLGVVSLALDPAGWKKLHVALLTIGTTLIAAGITSGASTRLWIWLID